MAKQAGPEYYTGTIGMACFYKMRGEYYVRLKSSLTGRRVKKDPAFRRTMENANILGEASRIASAVYRSVASAEKCQALYRRMTGIAMRMLKEKINPMKVMVALEVEFLSPVFSADIEIGTLCVNEEGVLQPIKVDWPPTEG